MADSTENKPKAGEKLPPGMVLGPDGKPCKLCTAFRNWKPTDNKPSDGSSTNGSTQKKSTRSMMAAFASGTGLVPAGPPENCPPDVEVLGRSTWTFLHTTAAYYPERPTPTQRANMLGLLHALPVLYPCSHCASHLGENMKISPPDVSSRFALSQWLCEQHNEVNERLGKKRFDCAKVDERWKDGPKDGSCD
jgi:mitochondrial FAD-linked sulfhydryl oxidase